MLKLPSILDKLFPNNYELIDGTDEIFELNFALWEYKNLSEAELIKRSAYFKSVNGKPTLHYQTCNLQNLEEIYKNSSLRTKAFFLNGKYSTGYATHSLFPYRGKFHPQMIRTLLSIAGIEKGDVVLDPMAGSGTLCVEANLLGIDSIGIDISPFCCLMGRVKTFSLDLNPDKLTAIASNSKELFQKLNKEKAPVYFLSNSNDKDKPYYEIILLAFLDAMGFARRSSKSLEVLFPVVLNRYVATINNFQKARKELGLKIGKSKIIQGDVTNLPLENDSVDGVITSPPYSFAIDYAENDNPQLRYLGYDVRDLKKDMLGLQGRGLNEKLQLYFEGCSKALAEMSRVAKQGSKIIIVIGTNEIQTKGVNLENKIKELAINQGLKFEGEMLKPIKGLSNTMQNEYILFFENTK